MPMEGSGPGSLQLMTRPDPGGLKSYRSVSKTLDKRHKHRTAQPPGIAKAMRFWLWTGTTSCWKMWRRRAWGWGSPSSRSAPASPPTGSSGTALSARIYDFLIVFWPVFRIHDILVWIRSRGSMRLIIMDPDPAIFAIDLQDANKKLI